MTIFPQAEKQMLGAHTKCRMLFVQMQYCLSKCNTVCPNAGNYIWHKWIWLFDNISGPIFFFFWGGGVKDFPRTACCCHWRMNGGQQFKVDLEAKKTCLRCFLCATNKKFAGKINRKDWVKNDGEVHSNSQVSLKSGNGITFFLPRPLLSLFLSFYLTPPSLSPLSCSLSDT